MSNPVIPPFVPPNKPQESKPPEQNFPKTDVGAFATPLPTPLVSTAAAPHSNVIPGVAPVSGVENKSPTPPVTGHVPPVSVPPVASDEKNAELAKQVALKNETLKGDRKFDPSVNPEKQRTHDQIVKILADYDNKESEIPTTSEYWDLLNRYRTMMR